MKEIGENRELGPRAYEFIEAMMLWDEIYYPDNEYSSWWLYCDKLNNVKKHVKPCDCKNDMFKTKAIDIYRSVRQDVDSEIVGVGAIEYWLLCNQENLDYLPCPKRIHYMNEKKIFVSQKSGLIISNEILNRIEIMNLFDNEVKERYNDMNKYFGKNIFDFELPVVIDYVKQMAKEGENIFEVANELKKDRSVIRYREYLSNIEHAIQNGDWKALSDFRNATKELVNSVDRSTKGISISASILALPSVNFNMPKVSKDFFQLSFLRKLNKFAFYERKKRGY